MYLATTVTRVLLLDIVNCPVPLVLVKYIPKRGTVADTDIPTVLALPTNSPSTFDTVTVEL
jgi:hypothetical protein